MTNASGTCILVMRHAEKNQDPDDPNLSAAGYLRAKQLATFIPERFGPPKFIFATAVSKHSARPLETVQPLASAIGVTIDQSFADQDYGALAKQITHDPRYTGRLTLVCWHHGNIPNLCRSLGAPSGEYPDPWNPTVFNLILCLTRSDQVSVTQVTEPF
jgi:broad specificity phosphatase PhoE